MRGTTPGLPSPYPMGTLMPAVYQEDPFAMRWLEGLDDILAPVIATLDCLDAYVDPHLAPEDFLWWLAGWVGITLDENWPAERARAAVAQAVELYRIRGTVTGLRAYLETLTGGQVTIADSGGVAWSQTPGADLPGEDTPRLAVRVTTADTTLTHDALEALVVAAKPAHVIHRLEIAP